MMHTNLRIHFVPHPVRDIIVIMEEGNRPHPLCPYCNMFVLWVALNYRHPNNNFFTQGEDQKRQRLVKEGTREGAATAFQSYGWPLEKVTALKYLGRLLTEIDADFLVVIINLHRARKI